MQEAYIDARYKQGDFPVTEDLCRTVISLPMHTELTEDQMNFIVNTVLNFINS